MDLQMNDYIVYRNAGVCQVIALEEQCMDGEHSILYYKLKPLADANSTYYIPVEKSDEKLRAPLTKAEVLALIDAMPREGGTDEIWSDNRRERKEMFTQVMRSDDHMAMLRMIASLYFRKRTAEAQGKRFSAMDETVMKNAETLMLQEFGFVLGMGTEELRKFVDARVSAIGNHIK